VPERGGRHTPSPDITQGNTPVAESLNIFLAGDVMTGRGIDQILPHPSEPTLYESYIRDARRYVALAEQTNGPIRRPVGFPYIWGDALATLRRIEPDVRIVNLETSITAIATGRVRASITVCIPITWPV
jgi:poly-gamma-glutamate synthesis protein (capsule biosynthesis protein)